MIHFTLPPVLTHRLIVDVVDCTAESSNPGSRCFREAAGMNGYHPKGIPQFLRLAHDQRTAKPNENVREPVKLLHGTPQYYPFRSRLEA
jgi:hypothetical protein